MPTKLLRATANMKEYQRTNAMHTGKRARASSRRCSSKLIKMEMEKSTERSLRPLSKERKQARRSQKPLSNMMRKMMREVKVVTKVRMKVKRVKPVKAMKVVRKMRKMRMKKRSTRSSEYILILCFHSVRSCR